ncbi:hypothetical protein WA026_018536 [Henosepilachna vigintioctopunctata]|uniref:UDP-glucuronosyltransferase n=1 Tax=Henosepilachna vigintioctopunctata TaxID=420089 RepID=A0AAW1U8L4_9CUCU
MYMLSLRLFYGLFLITRYADSSKILGIVWTHSRSHHILESALLQALAKRGHDVTILSPFKDDINLTNYRQEQLPRSSGFADVMTLSTTINLIKFRIDQQKTIQKHSEVFWKSLPVQNLIRSKEHFDLVIVLEFDNDGVMALAQHFGAPLILLNPLGSFGVGKYVGNPSLAYYSCPFHLVAANARHFFGRLLTATMNAVFYYEDNFIQFPNQQRLLRKYLPDAPPLEDIQNNISLILMNSHFSIERPRCFVPNMIPIGGFHTQKVEKLPEDIQEFLDNAQHGAVLFSFGTNVMIGSIEKKKLQIFLEGFAKISPVKVLLKSEIHLPNAPQNVLVRKWVPQNDVLAHLKIQAFITHGGLGGITEAVFHGVPMLGIPFFGDQKANVLSSAETGYTYPLNYEDITQESFDTALKEILWNKKYSDSMKLYSSLLKNQPVKPLDNAIWWVEHIMEHKGGKHLRNVAADLFWFELYMIDIILFYLALFLLSCFSCFLVLRYIFSLIFTKSKDKVKKL